MTGLAPLELRIAVGPGYVSQLLNSNDRGHWATKEARRCYWLDMTAYKALPAKGMFLGQHVHVTVTLAWPDRRRRDVNNYQPTAKPILDALVRVGVITDDSDRYVTGPDLRRAYGPHEIRLTITPTGDPK